MQVLERTYGLDFPETHLADARVQLAMAEAAFTIEAIRAQRENLREDANFMRIESEYTEPTVYIPDFPDDIEWRSDPSLLPVDPHGTAFESVDWWTELGLESPHYAPVDTKFVTTPSVSRVGRKLQDFRRNVFSYDERSDDEQEEIRQALHEHRRAPLLDVVETTQEPEYKSRPQTSLELVEIKPAKERTSIIRRLGKTASRWLRSSR